MCISDDLIEDVPLKYAGLKYEKRGGEVFVSLDQYKLSSPSCSKTPSNSNGEITTLKIFKKLAKGQLISIYLFGTIVWTRKPTKFFPGFMP